MIERGLYYATPEFSKMIQSVGGTWNDTKHRPMVCLIKSSEHPDLYWAIPMGKLNHRNQAQQQRLDFYLNLPERDIRSCYYHIGRTSSQSIFFISDAIPITDKYIDGVHVGGDQKHYIIKNKKLIAELERKLFRILSLENSRKNHFRGSGFWQCVLDFYRTELWRKADGTDQKGDSCGSSDFCEFQFTDLCLRFCLCGAIDDFVY